MTRQTDEETGRIYFRKQETKNVHERRQKKEESRYIIRLSPGYGQMKHDNEESLNSCSGDNSGV